MDDTLSWGIRWRWGRRQAQTAAAATTTFGGDGGDEPVLIAVISAPVEAEMAKDALAEAGIPAYVKQNSLGQVYGLSIGSFGTAEVWTPPVVAEQARDILIGIGVIQPDDEPST
jgi:hypothetical protein